uniref:Uncharacterized protein n=1 Tax=Aegilops tauschii subsp. strangulata TaxID=200361 RepID=A0A453L800_AEGTS
MLRTVGLKVVGNPNVYASLLGVLWSSVANRWHLEMPGIIDGSISIMSRTGLGIGMFNMGQARRVRAWINLVGHGDEVCRCASSHHDWSATFGTTWRPSACCHLTGCTASVYWDIYLCTRV